MPLKRPRALAEADAGAVAASVEPPVTKKPRPNTCSVAVTTPDQRDHISALSDELLMQILAFLDVQQLLDLSLMSRRFARLACDPQLWKVHYYERFALPRHTPPPPAKTAALKPVDWMRQFRTRHNWSKGTCAVEELRLSDGSPSRVGGQARAAGRPRVLVKVVQGIAVTADAESGLRVWDLKTRKIMAQTSLQPAAAPTATATSTAGDDDDDDDAGGMPSCLAVDGDRAPDSQTLRVALGFCDGSFGVWTLDIGRGGKDSVLVSQYRHEPSPGGRPGGRLAGMAYSHPFLLTATESMRVCLYTFDGPGADVSSAGAGGGAKWRPANLLTSLQSRTTEPPLTLSVRKDAASTTVATIAYTSVSQQGWSIVVQELHIKEATPTADTPHPLPQVCSTRLAQTDPQLAGRARRTWRRQGTRVTSSPDGDGQGDCQDYDDDDDDDDDCRAGPTALYYSCPYLLVTLPNNTLEVHLCKSSKSLTLLPPLQLWGHTSGIAGAEITSSGRAVSISARGDEMRVWEFERTNPRGGSGRDPCVTVRAANSEPGEAAACEDRRSWVGFDDEMIIVLKERGDGGESLMVHDFT